MVLYCKAVKGVNSNVETAIRKNLCRKKLSITQHAKQRMIERNVDLDAISRILVSGPLNKKLSRFG
jgi:hypothetical protein